MVGCSIFAVKQGIQLSDSPEHHVFIHYSDTCVCVCGTHKAKQSEAKQRKAKKSKAEQENQKFPTLWNTFWTSLDFLNSSTLLSCVCNCTFLFCCYRYWCNEQRNRYSDKNDIPSLQNDHRIYFTYCILDENYDDYAPLPHTQPLVLCIYLGNLRRKVGFLFLLFIFESLDYST